MHIEYAAYIGTICLIWARAVKWYNIIAKILTPIIKAAEQMSKDGKVEKNERKKLVMMAIDSLQVEGKIKLNLITRVIVSKVVDRIAEKLPDFTISQTAVDIVEKQKNVMVKPVVEKKS